MLRKPRPTFSLVRPLAAAAIVLLFVGLADAQSTRVVQVEEHWQLQLTQPDTDRSAPQVTMVMSPTANLEGVHFLFTLNHLAAPQYEPGGMQVQLWDGEEFLQDSVADASGSFEHADEVVTWVQRMSLAEGTLTFQVRDGHSQTWENFGGDNFQVQQSSALESLNHYRPAVSLTESQVNYAENRVGELVLTKLVWITEDGVVHEQNAPIPLDTSLE